MRQLKSDLQTLQKDLLNKTTYIFKKPYLLLVSSTLLPIFHIFLILIFRKTGCHFFGKSCSAIGVQEMRI